jgi:hypothetical protein
LPVDTESLRRVGLIAIVPNVAIAGFVTALRLNREPPIVPDPPIAVLAAFAVLAGPAAVAGAGLIRGRAEPSVAASVMAGAFGSGFSYALLPMLFPAAFFLGAFLVAQENVSRSAASRVVAVLVPAALGLAAWFVLLSWTETVAFSLPVAGGIAEGTQGGVFTERGAITALGLVALAVLVAFRADERSAEVTAI